MPPPVGKSKHKGREGRQSRSRNTTPSSTVEAPVPAVPTHTTFTEIPIGNLMVPSNITYDDILERHGGAGTIPDPSHLTTIAKDLKQLAELAAARADACNQAMRACAERRKEALAEESAREREREQARIREAEEKEALKKEAEDDDDIRDRKPGKQKKRKDRSTVREERPPNYAAHGLARQDGLDLPLEGELDFL